VESPLEKFQTQLNLHRQLLEKKPKVMNELIASEKALCDLAATTPIPKSNKYVLADALCTENFQQAGEDAPKYAAFCALTMAFVAEKHGLKARINETNLGEICTLTGTRQIMDFEVHIGTTALGLEIVKRKKVNMPKKEIFDLCQNLELDFNLGAYFLQRIQSR